MECITISICIEIKVQAGEPKSGNKDKERKQRITVVQPTFPLSILSRNLSTEVNSDCKNNHLLSK